MSSPVSPVPFIAISLAPTVEPSREPFSATSPTTPPLQALDRGFKQALLSPLRSPCSPRQSSPLRPAESPVSGHGLEHDRFDALLKASKERNAAGGKRSPDLRKEIALKAHKSKQVERRALFLSKVRAPPSPTATLEPKTPPESPAIFHFCLPSPGLESPLSVFEMLAWENPDLYAKPTLVEQVDFRLPNQRYKKSVPRTAVPLGRKNLPSLDEISARLSFQLKTAAPTFSHKAPELAAKPKRNLPSAVGRLQFPTRATSPATNKSETVNIHSPPCLPPPSPSSPVAPKLQITTTVVPQISSNSPVEFTESNLRALSSGPREVRSRDMLTRLRRRTLPPSEGPVVISGQSQDEERKLRRHSAPSSLPLRERVGFAGPRLNLPGAF